MSFAIISDARKGASLGIKILALVDRKKISKYWWTGDKASKIMHFKTEKEAIERCSKFKKGRARVVSFMRAKQDIRAQEEVCQSRISKIRRQQHERTSKRRSANIIPDLGV